jgi:hypothetical protein
MLSGDQYRAGTTVVLYSGTSALMQLDKPTARTVPPARTRCMLLYILHCVTRLLPRLVHPSHSTRRAVASITLSLSSYSTCSSLSPPFPLKHPDKMARQFFIGYVFLSRRRCRYCRADHSVRRARCHVGQIDPDLASRRGHKRGIRPTTPTGTLTPQW